MDTIEQEPVGEAEFTPSPDTSTDNTQPEETSEESTANEGEAGEAEVTLLAGKYKTPEELEKAYSELQGKLGEQSQKAELANILEKQTGMNAQQIRDYLSQQEQAQLEQRIKEDPSGYALQEVQTLKAQLALKEEQAELDGFLASNPEYAPFKDKILNLGLNLERDKSYADIANEYFGQARAQGQQDAYKKIETKTQSQTTGVKSAPNRTLTDEDFKNMSVAEMEAILPHADTSNRL
jgi:hypothetical protein